MVKRRKRKISPLQSHTPQGNWTETVLWQTLLKTRDPKKADVVQSLNSWMPKIEKILASGGTPPTAFTLHDHGHSFRVAQRMAEVIPNEVLSKLSAYEIKGHERLTITTGWAPIEKEKGELLQSGLSASDSGSTPKEYLPASDRKNLEAMDKARENISREMIRTVRWLSQEGALRNGLGRFRFHIPYFELPGGRSLVFLHIKKTRNILEVQKLLHGLCVSPHQNTLFSWKGMLIRTDDKVFSASHSDFKYPSLQVELDFHGEAAGSLSISRTLLNLSNEAAGAVAELRSYIGEYVQRFIKGNSASNYSVLNRRVCEIDDLPVVHPKWCFTIGKQRNVKWRNIAFPIVSGNPWRYNNSPCKVLWNGKPVQIPTPLRGTYKNDQFETISFGSRPEDL